MSTTALPPHLERVLGRLTERELHPRPNLDDEIRWDAECPICDGHLVIRDSAWERQAAG